MLHTENENDLKNLLRYYKIDILLTNKLGVYVYNSVDRVQNLVLLVRAVGIWRIPLFPYCSSYEEDLTCLHLTVNSFMSMVISCSKLYCLLISYYGEACDFTRLHL